MRIASCSSCALFFVSCTLFALETLGRTTTGTNKRNRRTSGSNLALRQLQDAVDVQVDDCGGCLPTQFCGLDSICHTTSCQNLYEYDFEFNTTELTGPLECFNIPLGSIDRSFLGIDPVCDNQLPYGLTMYAFNDVFSDMCGNDPGSCALVPGIPFTRKCLAQPQPWRRFYCYEVAPEISARELIRDYVAFTENVTATGLTPLHVVTKQYGFYRLGEPLYTNTTDNLADIVKFGILADWDVENEESWEYDQRFPPEHPGFPLCTSGCAANEFCGRNNVCYPYTCQNLYDYGPYEVVSYNETYPKGELVCTDNQLQNIDVGVECAKNPRTEWPIAAFFQCQVSKILDDTSSIDQLDYVHDACWTSDLDNRYIPFDRMCTAKNVDQQFECYEISDPMAAAQRYEQSIKAFSGQCSLNTLGDGYKNEVFAGQRNIAEMNLEYDGRTIYGTCSRDLVYEKAGTVGSVGYCSIQAGPFCSEFIDRERLQNTIYSQVKLTTSAARISSTTFLCSSSAVLLVLGLLHH